MKQRNVTPPIPRFWLRAACASILSLTTQAIAAPHDFDGDGKSDLTVARISTIAACALAPHQPCSTNSSLQQIVWYTKLSSNGSFKMRSLVSPDVYAGEFLTQNPTTTQAFGDSGLSPVLLGYPGNTVFLRQGPRYTVEYLADRGLAGHEARTELDFVLQPKFSAKEVAREVFGDRSYEVVLNTVVPLNRGYSRYTAVWDIRAEDAVRTVFAVTKEDPASSIELLTFPLGTPVPADYSGDGLDDLAVWNQQTGVWTLRDSSSGVLQEYQWGLPGDQPMPGDYDGDGRADLVVFRPSNGTWYFRFSAAAFDVAQSQSIQFGLPPQFEALPSGHLKLLSRDYPVQGDFDGDGKLDVAVYRTAGGNWFYRRSTDASVHVVQWGLAADLPTGTSIQFATE